MIAKKIILLNLIYIKGLLFFLLILTLPAFSETKIIAKRGDTLLKLSQKYGVTLKELMHKNNFNYANRILEGELIIIPSKNKDNDFIIHNVIKGDTLYRIARDYNVSVKEILSINKLDSSSYLKPNQIILLPKGAIYKRVVIHENIESENKKIFYHQTSAGENLIDIAKIHNVQKEEIIALNKLSFPIKINPNTKLKIRKNNSIKLLKYGPLKINWSDWTFLDGNYITQAKNKRNRSFYLAVSCKKRALNNTIKNSSWTSWYYPKVDFEYKLINDFCDQSLKN